LHFLDSLIKRFPNISADFRIALTLHMSVVTGEELFSAEADKVTQPCCKGDWWI